jgi:hypothetical protein
MYALAQAVSRQPHTAETMFHAVFNPCGFDGGQIDTGTGFSNEFFGLPCQYHSARAPYLYITWGMNSRPVVGHSSET